MGFAGKGVEGFNFFSVEEKELILVKPKTEISNEGYLSVISQKERSHLMNKKNTIDKFFKLINGCLAKTKFRKKTKPRP
jgi:hypothetical protein